MKIIASNRRAKFDYEIVDRVEAGIVLTGQEVKSARMGHVDLRGSYVSFLNGKAVLKQAKISPYAFASGIDDYNPGRDRPLLLKKNELEKLRTQSEQKGVTIIPLEVHAGTFIKVLLGLAKGRKTIDKRTVIREREMSKKLRKGEEV